jgi:hypothetical protein
MACVAAAHATWIPKEAEAAPASFSLQLRSRLDVERLRHAHRYEKPDTASSPVRQTSFDSALRSRSGHP